VARLHKVLEEILVEAGALKPIEMGPSSSKPSATPEGKERLMERLQAQSKFNGRFLKSVIAVHFLSFIVPFLLAYFLRASLATAALILSLTVALLLGITRLLSDLWQTKMGIDVLIALLPDLSPQQAVEALKALYHTQSKRSSNRVTTTDRFKL
jgi:hypothetical protein